MAIITRQVKNRDFAIAANGGAGSAILEKMANIPIFFFWIYAILGDVTVCLFFAKCLFLRQNQYFA